MPKKNKPLTAAQQAFQRRQAAYWQSRQELAIEVLTTQEQRAMYYEEQLQRNYDVAMYEMRSQLERFYGKYATTQKINFMEAQRLLTGDELKQHRQDLEQYIADVKAHASDPAWRQELERRSVLARVTRLDALLLNIRAAVEKLATESRSGLRDVLHDAYEDSYYKTMYDIQQGTGIGISFDKPSEAQIATACMMQWNGSNYSDRVWNNKDILVRALSTIIPQSFIAGNSIPQLVQKLQEKVTTSQAAAVRLVRTEVNRVANAGTIKSYMNSGVVTEYEFVATLDWKTSQICQDMDGQRFKVKDARVGINLPPLHPHCRSTTIPYYDDNAITQRIARANNGINYHVPEDITYSDWVSKYASRNYEQRQKMV